MISRIATFANTSSLMTAGLSLQAKLAEAQAQQASGLKATTYGALSGDASKLLALEGRTARLQAQSDAATSAVSTMEQAYSALGDISDLATSIQAELASRISGTADTDDLAALAGDWLDALGELLNSQSGDSYLFSGQATDRAAVDLSLDEVYVGSSEALRFTTETGRAIALSVTADDPGIQNLVAGLKALATATDTSAISAAYDQIGEGLSGVASAQEALSARTNALNDYQARLDTQIATLETLSVELSGADLAEATVTVTNYQTQLETLYSTLAALSQVKLIDFL